MKHFRNKQKCGRKPYFLARSKILLKTITSHNLEKDIKRGKFALILFFSLSFLFILFFILFWFLLVTLLVVPFGQCKFFYKTYSARRWLCVQGYLCNLFLWCSTRDLDWQRSFDSSLNWRLSGSQRERYGHSIGIFTGGLVVSWELVIRDHSCDRLLMMLPVVWLAQWGTKAS